MRPAAFASDADRLQILSHVGGRIIEAPSAFLTSESKVQTMLRLREAGIAIADTQLCHTLGEVSEVVAPAWAGGCQAFQQLRRKK